jgi:hypothetical protein
VIEIVVFVVRSNLSVLRSVKVSRKRKRPRSAAVTVSALCFYYIGIVRTPTAAVCWRRSCGRACVRPNGRRLPQTHDLPSDAKAVRSCVRACVQDFCVAVAGSWQVWGFQVPSRLRKPPCGCSKEDPPPPPSGGIKRKPVPLLLLLEETAGGVPFVTVGVSPDGSSCCCTCAGLVAVVVWDSASAIVPCAKVVLAAVAVAAAVAAAVRAAPSPLLPLLPRSPFSGGPRLGESRPCMK